MSRGKTDTTEGMAASGGGNTAESDESVAGQPRAKTTRARRKKTEPDAAASASSASSNLSTDPRSSSLASSDRGSDGPSRLGLDAEVRAQAYEIYLSRDSTDGDATSDWLEAERIVRTRRQSRDMDMDERASM